MAILPDLGALRSAADAIDATAAVVDADAAMVAQRIEALPWTGLRRQTVVGSTLVAVGAARGQADAERELARALRRLAGEVEQELRLLAELAARARRHLEDLLRRARALVEQAWSAVADAAARVGEIVVDVLTFDPSAALREARALADQAVDRLRQVTDRLGTLPEPHDPVWRRLGPEVLSWRPA